QRRITYRPRHRPIPGLLGRGDAVLDLSEFHGQVRWVPELLLPRVGREIKLDETEVVASVVWNGNVVVVDGEPIGKPPTASEEVRVTGSGGRDRCVDQAPIDLVETEPS